jgi:hypothetical protein
MGNSNSSDAPYEPKKLPPIPNFPEQAPPETLDVSLLQEAIVKEVLPLSIVVAQKYRC